MKLKKKFPSPGRRGSPLPAALLICLGFIVLPSSRADTIWLRNGNPLHGRIERADRTLVILRVSTGILRISRVQIERIEWDDPVGYLESRSTILSSAGRFEEARALLEASAGDHGKSIRFQKTWTALFRKWVRMRLSEGRLSQADEALLLHGKHRGGDLTDLEKAVRKAWTVLDEQAKAVDAMASTGAFGSAREILLSVLKARPGTYRSVFRRLGTLSVRRAETMEKAGRPLEALEQLYDACGWNPNLTDFFSWRFAALLRTLAMGRGTSPGNRSEALAWSNRFAALYPYSEPIRALLGYLRGEEEAAVVEEGRWRVIIGQDRLNRVKSVKSGEPNIQPWTARGKIAVSGNPGILHLVLCSAHAHRMRVGKMFGVVHAMERLPLRIQVRDVPRDRKMTGLPSWAGGETRVSRSPDGETAVLLICSDASPQLLTGVLPHEMGHLAFHLFTDFAEDLPLWLHEGAALEAETPLRHLHVKRLLRAIADTKLMPSLDKTLARLDYPETETALDGFYALSFGLFRFVRSREGLAGVKAVADLARRLPVTTALCSVLGLRDGAALKKAFFAWVGEGTDEAGK